MNHNPTSVPPDERREHLWAVIGALTLRHRRSKPDGPARWPRRTAEEHEEWAQGQRHRLGQSEAHLLDFAFELLSSLSIHQEATDTDLLLEAIRAERLKVQVEQYQQALLTLLHASSRQRARTTPVQGRDLFVELQANTISDEALKALLPWPARQP